MNIQVGLLHHDEKPVTPEDCLNILGKLADTEFEIAGQQVDGSIGMAYRGERMTAEDANDVQPLRYGPYILTFDGRLDNRDELAAQLNIRIDCELPDSLLLAQAYTQFADDIWSKLIGEFAICLWNYGTNSLRLARSVCGSRPLYYITAPGGLLWSSDFRTLITQSPVDLEIDEMYAVQYLISDPSPSRSPLRLVHAVTPGTTLLFEPNRAPREQRFWSTYGIPPLTYSTDQQYEEHCHSLLTDAVRVRLRALGNVFSELSGGFDSSSVVLIGDQILAKEKRQLSKLHTLSCVYEQSETCDESAYIRSIEEWRNQESFKVNEQDQDITLGFGDLTFSGVPSPLHCFPGRYRKFSDVMRRHNARVLLTGLGGDHLFWSSCDASVMVADCLQAWNFAEAHRQCRIWSRAMGSPYIQLLSRAASLCFSSQYLPASVPSWLAERHKSQAEQQIDRTPDSGRRDLQPSQRAQIRLVAHLLTVIAAGYLNEYSDIYITHPYSHRPLLEFCLAVPASQLVRNGEMRSLMRRALGTILPPKLLQRKSKGMIDEALIRVLQREWQEIGDVTEWQVCQRGLVDAQRLRDSLERMRVGLQLTQEPLIRVFTFERWLRALAQLRTSPKTTFTSGTPAIRLSKAIGYGSIGQR
jgi:asparagine synthase (glutamine-hydrolysing)